MARISALKKQCQLRHWPDDHKRIQAKLKEDGLSYQKLGEALFKAYLNNNKEIRKVIETYLKIKPKEQSSSMEMSEDEVHSILNELEEEDKV